MTNNYPLVTIGIPTYNRANAYLKDAIQCALDQTYTNVEILISDNCSTDHTESLVKSFKDPRIRYTKQKNNIGPTNNFNYCVMNSKGVFFLLLHDDDLIDKDFIEVCIKATNNNKPVGIIRTGMRRIDSEGKAIGETENKVGGLPLDQFFLGWFNGKTPMHLCSTLFNTNKLIEIGGFKSKNNLFQDVFAEVILATKFGRIDICDIKASFRSHPDQNTNSAKVKDWCEDSLLLLNTICELTPQNSEILKRTGLKFFARHNFNIASKIQSPLGRYMAHIIIFKMFGYQLSYWRPIMRQQIMRVKKILWS